MKPENLRLIFNFIFIVSLSRIKDLFFLNTMFKCGINTLCLFYLFIARSKKTATALLPMDDLSYQNVKNRLIYKNIKELYFLISTLRIITE